MKKTLVIFIVIFLVQVVSSSAQDIDTLKAGVVKITAQPPGGSRKTGSGFIVQLTKELVYIVTASHVVEGDSSPEVEFFIRQFIPVSARVVALEVGDRGLALLLVSGEDNIPAGLSALPPSPSVSFDDGDEVIIIGFPLLAVPWSVIRGNITARQGRDIIFDASIDEGNSGGPLIKEGQVVGLVTGKTGDFGRATLAESFKLFVEGSNVDLTPPGNIVSFTVAQGGNSREITGSWTNPTDDDIVGVRFIFRTDRFPKNALDGTDHIDVLGLNSLTLTNLDPEMSYYITGFSYDKFFNYSSGTDSNISINPRDLTPPADVTNLSPIPGDKLVDLTWKGSLSRDVEGYKVYTKVSGGSYDSGIDVGNVTSYRKEGLINRAQYIFKLTVYDEVPNESEGEETESVTPGDNTLPGAIIGFTVVQGTKDGEIMGIWTNPSDDDIVGVRFRYRTDRYPTGARDGIQLSDETGSRDISVTRHTWTGLNPEITYYIAGFAYDEVFNYSSGTDANRSIKPRDLSPPADVTNLSPEPGDKLVDLTWKGSPIRDVEGYKVYTKISGGSYDSGDGVGNVTSYRKEDLTNGTSYIFKITAFDEVPNESGGIETDLVTPGDITPPDGITSITAIGKDGKKIVFIPGGTFTMGSNNWDNDEKPPHQVTVNSFWMDITEVTKGEYKEFLDATEYDGSREADGDFLKDWSVRDYPAGKGNHPVGWISWKNARAYCKWADKRLPTEAEWEYAAGGSEHYKWSLGSTFDESKYSFRKSGTESVGIYPANGYGLHDMSGSVSEWVSSLNKDYPYHSDDGRENLDASGSRVLRGGSWLSGSSINLRIANRNWGEPFFTNSNLGFRCLQSVFTVISKDGKEMAFIPGGPFTMGRNDGGSYTKSHQVTVNSFWIDVTEVTNAQFKKFRDNWSYNPGKANHPVVNVNWYDAVAYCKWAGKRLPTEAEWEYAAGGPEHYKWSLGNTFDSNKYSFRKDSTEQVRSYEANGFGLYDMSGSVFEWVSSLDKDYPYRSDDGREDLNASGTRMSRGGSWSNTNSLHLRTAIRLGNIPSITDEFGGFRCLQY